MRIGHGYDVHKLVENRKLILGGIDIPYVKGLDGHSDADVVVHALMDAMLGAVAKGDIGHIFPDNDDKFLNADSIELLKEVKNVVRPYIIINADCTIICQKPKLAPYISQMRQNIADALDTEVENISIKATTEEKLGFTGQGLGISAHAVVLMEKE